MIVERGARRPPVGRASSFHERAFLRRWARFGAERGPRFFIQAAAWLLGWFFFLCLPRARRAVLHNVRWIQGRRDAWREILDAGLTFTQFAACLTESLGASRPEARESRAMVRGEERIQRLIETKKGFVILTAHIGPWDGAAQLLAHEQGASVMLVMAREGEEESGQIQDEVRGAARVKVRRIGGHPLDALPVLQHLEQGGIVAAQFDRVPPGQMGVETRLFGRRFLVPAGPLLLAGLAGVPVLPIFAARTGYFRRKIDIGFPLYPSRRPGREELASLSLEVTKRMEAHLAAFPRQWFHFVAEEDPVVEEGGEEPA